MGGPHRIYIGREVCLIAVRVWRPDTEGLELRFHVNEVIAKA